MSLWSWLTRQRTALDERDFEEEIHTHLAMAEQEAIESGTDRASARHEARRSFGNRTLTTEAARRVWTPRWLQAVRDLFTDVRYGVRSLVRNPAFSLIAVAVLTLGVGLNALVFTMLKGLALAPLAGVERSSQLRVVMRETGSGRQLRLSYPDFQFLREHDRVFAGLMGSMFRLDQFRLGRSKESQPISVEFVTGNYFDVLGVRAALGRTLLPSDEIAPGRHPVVVLSHSLWRREYRADPGIVGRTIEINRYPLTVVGVADAGFHGTVPLYDVEVFIPVMMLEEVGAVGLSSGAAERRVLSDRSAPLLLAHGFLRPDMSAAASAQLDTLWSTRPHASPDAEHRLRLLPFWQSPVGPQTYMMPILTVLSVMGSLVLLITCANIAGLVLARGASRRGELAARLALGASRLRIIRLLLVENLVLVLPGMLLGMLLAQRGALAFVAYLQTLAAPQRLFFDANVDGLTLAFAALIASLCALVFGLLPALQTSRVDLVSVINEDATPRSARGRLRTGLVTAQVAISMVLLIGAGLVVRSLDEASQADTGFDAAHTTVIPLDVQQLGYNEARGRAFYRQLLDAVRTDATTESATLAVAPPLAVIQGPSERLAIDGYTPRIGEDVAAQFNTVGTDYFSTLRISLVAGREFEESDNETGAPVVIVNGTFAERFWGSAREAVGRRIRVADDEWRTVIGVAADVKYERINESPRPYFYLPFDQAYRPIMFMHTRGRGDPAALVARARTHVAALDPGLQLVAAAPLADVTRISLMFFQITATMLFVFGAAGMMLAAIGMYGLVSYTVTQRTREIGIRMALGATARSVIRAFVGRSLRLGATGAIVGLVVALATSRFLASQLFGVTATDGSSFAAALAVVFGGVIAATIVPAWRAARTNPVVALRHH